MKTELEPIATLTEQPRATANTVHESDSAPVERVTEKTKFRFPRALTYVPVRPDGSPDWSLRAVGLPLDVTPDGELEINWKNAPDLPTTSLIAFHQDADGTRRVMGIDIESMEAREQTGLRIKGRVGGFAGEILSPEKTMPSLNRKIMTFELGFPEPMLDQWVAVGAMERVLIDKVEVCPRCQGVPTFREGCPNCGSANLDNDYLIHHFACAHVGRVCDFEVDGDIVCPKCRVRRLVVGSDFDYVTGPYRCVDCRWSNVEPEQVAQCMQCQFRFPAYQAKTQDLRGFRAHRLDPLAYFPAH
jgi:hypothetical protein